MAEFLPMLERWIVEFCGSASRPGAAAATGTARVPITAPEVDFGMSIAELGARVNLKTGRRVAVDQIADIEENVWSPRFGLKGKVDATLRLRLQDHTGAVRAGRMPFELKTGRVSAAGVVGHRAQVILYMLMLGDRYAEQVESGLLLCAPAQPHARAAQPHRRPAAGTSRRGRSGAWRCSAPSAAP